MTRIVPFAIIGAIVVVIVLLVIGKAPWADKPIPLPDVVTPQQ